LLALDIFCLVDLFRAEEVFFLPKGAWAIVILVVHLLGPIAYLMFGRKRHGGVAGIGVNWGFRWLTQCRGPEPVVDARTKLRVPSQFNPEEPTLWVAVFSVGWPDGAGWRWSPSRR
jgi:Phospholipase_D-nuclease N-terminal